CCAVDNGRTAGLGGLEGSHRLLGWTRLRGISGAPPIQLRYFGDGESRHPRAYLIADSVGGGSHWIITQVRIPGRHFRPTMPEQLAEQQQAITTRCAHTGEGMAKIVYAA